VVRVAGNQSPVLIPATGTEGLGWVPPYAEAQISAREASLGKD
jgi:hypothetical protein